MEPRDVFISHAEEDGPTASALAEALRAQHLTVWTYEEDGIPGISHLEQSCRAIESCRAFVLLASPQSVKAHQVICEVEEAHEGEKVIIAVRLGLSHQEFVASNRILRMACGTAVTLAADEGKLPEVAKRISGTLRFAESQLKGTQTPEAEHEGLGKAPTATVPAAITPTPAASYEQPTAPDACEVSPFSSVSAAQIEGIDAPNGASVLRRSLGAERLWPPVWLSIIGQFYLAGLVLDYVHGEHPVIVVAGAVVVAGCGLGFVWAFVKLRDSSSATISSPFMNLLLGISLAAQVVTNLAVEPRFFWFTVPSIAFIWNGWRVLRKPVNAAAVVT